MERCEFDFAETLQAAYILAKKTEWADGMSYRFAVTSTDCNKMTVEIGRCLSMLLKRMSKCSASALQWNFCNRTSY